MPRGILGIGLDMIELQRIEAAWQRFGPRFLARILTPDEQRDVGNPPRVNSLAARFAAKEAVAKAMGTGIRGFAFTDIEVVPDKLGRPTVTLHGEAARIAASKGIQTVWVSLTHSASMAAATAVAEGGGRNEH